MSCRDRQRNLCVKLIDSFIVDATKRPYTRYTKYYLYFLKEKLMLKNVSEKNSRQSSFIELYFLTCFLVDAFVDAYELYTVKQHINMTVFARYKIGSIGSLLDCCF